MEPQSATCLDDAVLSKLRRASILQAVRNLDHMDACDGCIVCDESQKVILYATVAELDEAVAAVRGVRTCKP